MKKNINACLTSGNDEWRTPSNIYNHFVNKLNCLDLFPFGSKSNQFDIVYDNKRLFCNPPFSKLSETVDYLLDLHFNHNCEIWLLMPCRTDTKYFYKLFSSARITVYFFNKRLHFNDSKSAPFPSMLIHIHKFAVYPMFWVIDPSDL